MSDEFAFGPTKLVSAPRIRHPKAKRIGFGGILPDDKRIPDDLENSAALKWLRANQKRELRAYLKGHTNFRHGGRDGHSDNPPRWFKVRQVERTA